MGNYFDHEELKWKTRKIIIFQDLTGLQWLSEHKCLCYLSECNCQFQRHTNCLVFCSDPEIFQLCLNNEDINYGDD